MAIYQDLVDQHGFGGAYNSVKRFAGGLRQREPEQFDRLEFAPGEEAQVDYGEGAPTRAREDWQVLIKNAHAGFITWDDYEHNQTTLKQNALGFGQDQRGSTPREGVGLLQGRIICGHCGARMRVRYQEVGGKLEPYYVCTELCTPCR